MFHSKRHLYNPILPVSIVVCFILLMPSAGFYACKSQAKKDSLLTDSLRVIQLPAASPISENEKRVYAEGCRAWCDSHLFRRGFNGGLLVAKKGNIVFESYNGSTHLDGKEPVTDSTPFHIASVSKTFTAMAVLKLWQEGKINIDDEYNKFFPTFNYPGVTIRCLLDHRSGLPNYLYFMETLGWNKAIYVRNQDVFDYLTTKKAQLTNIASPNSRFTYCNTNYALLALLIEKITGGSYSAYLNNSFFKPLGMKHSFVFDTTLVKKVPLSYDWRGREIPFGFLDAVYGDKNIYTTPRDLMTWDRALITGKIFTAATLEAAYSPYSNEKPGIRNYGLGWRMNIYPTGEKMIYHNGWWHGNNASLIRLLADSAVIIVVGNKFNSEIYHAKEMAVLFGNYDKIEEEEEGGSGAAVAPVAVPKAPEVPAKVTRTSVKKIKIKPAATLTKKDKKTPVPAKTKTKKK